MTRTRHPASRFSLIVPLTLALVFGSAGVAMAQSGTPAATPAGTTIGVAPLEPTPCATRYQLPEPFVDGQNVTCAYLSVPAFPDEIGSPVIRLHIMHLTSTGSAQAAEPLLLLTGGPGQAAGALLSAFAPPVDETTPSLAPLLERQDVYLLDQRGTGASEPSLTCPFDVIPTLLPPGQSAGTPVAATPIATPTSGTTGTPGAIQPTGSDALADLALQCLSGFTSQGIDLTAFNTENDAADVAALIRSIGVGPVDLYGVSYGSYLGQRVITRNPELVRSAVLASIVPPGTDLFLGQIIGFNGVLSDLFSLCSADPECAAANPDPDTALAGAYDRLTAQPTTVQATDFTSAATVPIVIDGETFLNLAYQLAFASLSYIIPPLLTSVAAGDDALLTQIAPLLLTPSGISTGLLAANDCQDFTEDSNAGPIDAQLAAAAVRTPLVQGFTGSVRSFEQICAGLQLPVSAAATEPTVSDVPTLLISGEFDPITPPEYADEVIGGLSNGQQTTINAVGHDPVSASGPCGLQLTTSFLAAPTEEVDQTCASQLSLDLSPEEMGGGTPAATPAG